MIFTFINCAFNIFNQYMKTWWGHVRAAWLIFKDRYLDSNTQAMSFLNYNDLPVSIKTDKKWMNIQICVHIAA